MEDKALLEKVGNRIKEIRESKNITQQELAARCDYEKSNMSRIESGNTNPTLLTLYKICTSLDISLEELMSGVE